MEIINNFARLDIALICLIILLCILIAVLINKIKKKIENSHTRDKVDIKQE